MKAKQQNATIVLRGWLNTHGYQWVPYAFRTQAGQYSGRWIYRRLEAPVLLRLLLGCAPLDRVRATLERLLREVKRSAAQADTVDVFDRTIAALQDSKGACERLLTQLQAEVAALPKPVMRLVYGYWLCLDCLATVAEDAQYPSPRAQNLWRALGAMAVYAKRVHRRTAPEHYRSLMAVQFTYNDLAEALHAQRTIPRKA